MNTIAAIHTDPLLPAAVPSTTEADSRDSRFPRPLVFSIIGICLVPFAASLLGFDFGSDSTPLDVEAARSMTSHELVDAMFRRLSGAFTHTILEWTAFCAALFTVLLAFIHYRLTNDVTTPIIGVALFCAGSMDVFHTLTADRLIEAVADNRNLIPFTWAISRTFNALIMVVGVYIILFRDAPKSERGRRDVAFLLSLSVAFTLAAYGIIWYCANSTNLPQTMYPDSLITRPWDVGPLLLFVFAGLVAYPRFNRSHPSLFAHALLISAVPAVVVQLHMAFGSTALFDHDFNIAHFLKAVSYIVPFLGLALDYIQTHRRQQRAVAALEANNAVLANEVREREAAEAGLMHANRLLRRSNEELDRFAYVASHDLKSPLRSIDQLASFIAEDAGERLDEASRSDLNLMRERVNRMDGLPDDLLAYSRIGRKESRAEDVSTETVVAEAVNLLGLPTGSKVATDPSLPKVHAPRVAVELVFRNLIGNAFKHHDRQTGKVNISYREPDGQVEFAVQDDGPGIPDEFREQVFEMFRTLKPRDVVEGSGMGLAMVKKSLESFGGGIQLDPNQGRGATFRVTWPAASQSSKGN